MDTNQICDVCGQKATVFKAETMEEILPFVDHALNSYSGWRMIGSKSFCKEHGEVQVKRNPLPLSVSDFMAFLLNWYKEKNDEFHKIAVELWNKLDHDWQKKIQEWHLVQFKKDLAL